tara:strand:+ start:161 stop:421 length:261 start_codon:yes stop_codon:yes gene_type:complete
MGTSRHLAQQCSNQCRSRGDAPLEAVSTDAFERIFEIILIGTMLACKHSLPIMRAQKSEAIVNISSASAHWTGHPTVLYPDSKWQW